MEEWMTIEIIKFSPEGEELMIRDVTLPEINWAEVEKPTVH